MGRPIASTSRSHPSPTRHRLTVLAAVLLASLAAGLPVAAASGAAVGTQQAVRGIPASAVPADDPTVPGRLLLLLDASGSMNAKDPSGLTKIAAAKKALVAVVNGLPTDSQVGLRVYGATQAGGKPTPAACADTQLVHPITALDTPGLDAAINRFKAKGETPIAHSIDEAVKDLGATGKRNIVLVSDGEESCVADPCPSIKAALGAGVDLQIDTVGFGVNSKARKQLQCIADVGHGSYYDAADSAELSTSLNKLSQRALRPFSVTGTPVTATEAPEAAPVLTPGQYTDAFAGKTAPRSYKLARQPGSTVRVSVVARPPEVNHSFATETWKMWASTENGTSCGYASAVVLEFFRNGEAMTVELTVNGANSLGKSVAGVDVSCANEPLIIKVQREEGTATPQAVEVLYVEEPPAVNPAALPQGLDPETVTPLTAKASGAGTPIVGGGSFSNALTLTPGTYSDTILAGEQIFYRVRLEDGQRAALTIDAPTPGHRFSATKGAALLDLDAWTPARRDITRTGGPPSNRSELTTGRPSLVLGEYTAEVRFRNRTSLGNGYNYPALRETSIPGFYYFALSRSLATGDANTTPPLPIRVAVAVIGTPGGAPAYATGPGDATSTATPTPTATGTRTTTPPVAAKATAKESSTSWLVWVGGGIAALAALGYAAYLALRRRAGATPVGERP